MQASNNVDITLSLVTDLIAEQFPQWSSLPIKPVDLMGWDNRTFRLGDTMSIRLPTAECYAAKVQLEQKWLPFLAAHMSDSIPTPLALGLPSKNYPFHWSVYRWIEGRSANLLDMSEQDLSLLAVQLADFLNQLHAVATAAGPPPGPHNFYRGAHPSVYDQETRSAIAQLQDFIDNDLATAVWEKALSSQWSKDPLWLHGDLSSGNIIIRDNQLAGVIDFGGMAIGDPACDLVIAWTFLKKQSRKVFKSHLVGLDHDTWARARGWGLWKALITLVPLDKERQEAIKQVRVIDEIISEHLAE